MPSTIIHVYHSEYCNFTMREIILAGGYHHRKLLATGIFEIGS
jgi:hypothetical protein